MFLRRALDKSLSSRMLSQALKPCAYFSKCNAPRPKRSISPSRNASFNRDKVRSSKYQEDSFIRSKTPLSSNESSKDQEKIDQFSNLYQNLCGHSKEQKDLYKMEKKYEKACNDKQSSAGSLLQMVQEFSDKIIKYLPSSLLAFLEEDPTLSLQWELSKLSHSKDSKTRKRGIITIIIMCILKFMQGDHDRDHKKQSKNGLPVRSRPGGAFYFLRAPILSLFLEEMEKKEKKRKDSLEGIFLGSSFVERRPVILKYYKNGMITTSTYPENEILLKYFQEPSKKVSIFGEDRIVRRDDPAFIRKASPEMTRMDSTKIPETDMNIATIIGGSLLMAGVAFAIVAYLPTSCALAATPVAYEAFYEMLMDIAGNL